MQKIVEQFLAQQEEKKRAQEQERRAQHLLELGLYREEEVPDEEAGQFEYRDGKRVRLIPVELTEEEYAAVCVAATEEEAVEDHRDWPILPVHKILYVLAVCVYALGAIQLFAQMEYGFAAFLMALYGVLWSAIGGTLLLAVSELLRLFKKRCGE